MNRDEALRIVEAFGNGIPPEEYVVNFTVGKESDIRQLRAFLHRENPHPLMLQSESGSGKSHYLRFVREIALEEGFVVSLVALDSSLEVSFHKMDLIHGAVCRGIEVPGKEGRGFTPFMSAISEKIYAERSRRDPESFWTRLSNNWQWDTSELLRSPCLYIALRGWVFGGDDKKDLIDDWFSHPWHYYTNRDLIFYELIYNLRAHFRDPRSKGSLMAKGRDIFRYDLQQYGQCWDVLNDLRTLSQAAGYKDFIMLFDRTDDVVDHLNHLRWQKSAFRNLLRFFSVDSFGGTGLFAASPDFIDKCRDLLVNRGSWAEEFFGLNNLPIMRIHDLGFEELNDLARRIAGAYGIAYGCEDRIEEAMKGLREVVKKTASLPVPEKTRLTVRAIVEHLDHAFGEDE